MTFDRKILVLACFLAAAFYVGDAVVDVVVFGHGTVTEQLFSASGHEIYMRLLMGFVFLAFGLYTARMVARVRESEKRQSHLNRVLRGIRDVNQLIVRERDRNRLLAEACRILVEARGYPGAWIALVPDGDPTSRPSFMSGFEANRGRMDADLKGMELPACGARALEADGMFVVRDPIRECPDCSLVPAHLNRAGMAVPLAYQGSVFGCLVVSVPRGHADDSEERALLEEVGVDLGHALWARDVESRSGRKRREAEEELIATTHRMATLMDSSPMGVHLYELGSDGELIFRGCNPAAERLTGVDGGALMGRTIEEAFPDLADTEIPDRYRAIAAGAGPWRNPRVVHDDGSMVGIFEVVAFQTAPGEVAAVFNDITLREEAEAGLRESEERFRNVIEQSNDAIYILHEGHLDLVNQKFLDLHGITREEALSPDFDLFSFLTPSSRPIIEEREAKRARGEPLPPVYSFSIQKPSGEILSLEASVTEIDYRGGRAILGFVRDTSEQKALEVQLQQAQKMESVGRLSGGVAHDLNNLLTPVIGFGEMLAEDQLLDASQRDAAVEIVRAAFRAKDLVRQLLAFGRRQTLDFEPIDLNRMIGDFEPLLRRTIREDIAIELSLEPSLPVILGDRGQLEQVVMNLAINARDAMEGGGRLLLETKQETLEEEDVASLTDLKPGRFVSLILSDTGVGMEEDVRERVFEPFFTTREVGNGTGLGLAMVYGIIKQHGGTIRAESEPGLGSTFRCYFPVAEAMALEEEEPDAGVPATGGSETIMIVEDEELVRNLAVTVLRRAGYAVLEAGDARECLDRLKDHSGSLDLLLTDVVMPGMNGRELYEKVAARFENPRVLFMSGYTEDVVSHEGVLEEGIAFIPKPFSVSALAAKVREVLDAE